MSKLDWSYNNESGEQHAHHKGFRIRAVLDDHCDNPLDDDGHWPMIVRSGGFTEYDKVKGYGPDNVLHRFSDAQIVHDQIAIAAVFGTTVLEIMQGEGHDEPVKYFDDADYLRNEFDDQLSNVYDGQKLDILAQLYALLGIPHVHTTSSGYSQGDYAEHLIIATPEAQLELRSQPEDMPDDEWLAELDRDMNAQSDLWGPGAWGDVYGYIVERAVRLPDCDPDDDPEYEEVSDGSCWGYYGDDHGKSGLEESAMEVIDDHIDAARKARQAKLIAMIRNKVPLTQRSALLAEAEELSYA